MKENACVSKSFEFAVRIVNLYKYLSAEHKEYVLSKQLLRCGTSIGANVAEAQRGQSRADFLAKMKKSAMLINTSRGQVVNENDLADALKNGVISAAGLDVLSSEPPKADNPLFGLKNCYITPHIAWAGFETRARLMDICRKNLEAFAKALSEGERNFTIWF